MTSSGAALWRGRGPVQGSRKCQDGREGNSEMWLRMGGGNLREIGTWAGLGVKQRSVGEEAD